MLRWLTAGESHGPSLVAILEGLPAHVQVTTADIQDALARRRLGYGRGARMKFEQDEVTISGGVRHGETIGGPVAIEVGEHRVAQVGEGDVGRPGRPRRAGRAGPQRRAHPAPARARRPGRHAEVRLRRGPPGPRAGLGPRDRRPGGAGPGGLQLPRAGRRRPDRLARHRARRRAGARRAVAGARRRRPSRRGPGPLPGPGRLAGDGGRDRPGAQGRGHPRRRGRGGRARPAAGPGLARALGPPPGLPARGGADGHPGDQGRRGRGRLRARRHPRLAGRTTRSCRPTRASGGSAVAPAAPRGA